jgi:hypothetical protein
MTIIDILDFLWVLPIPLQPQDVLELPHFD